MRRSRGDDIDAGCGQLAIQEGSSREKYSLKQFQASPQDQVGTSMIALIVIISQ